MPLKICLLLLFLANPGAHAVENLLKCSTVPKLFAGFLTNHLSVRDLTPEVKRRTVQNYVKMIDSSKTLLHASEAKRLNKELQGLFTMMVVGDCSQLNKAQKLLVVRAKENEEFVRKVLSDKKYKLDESTVLTTDPDKRSYAKNKADRLKVVKKFIHFQISNYLESGTKLKDAKERLIHRYELTTKRLSERKMPDILPLFLNSFASALDPHSSYFSPDDLEDFKISMGLSLEGIGASLTWKDGFTTVEEIIPGGAADRVNTLRPKDKIIAVAQDEGTPVDVIDMELRKVVSYIRGKKGTGVTLTVLRQGQKTNRFTTRIIRDKIDLKEQAAKLTYREVESGGKKYRMALLDLPSFYGDNDRRKRSSYTDVKRLLQQLRKEKVAGLLLDLSRNGGGLLDDAVKISGLFLKKGGMVATQIARKTPEILEDTDTETYYSGPMVVLTSRISASASEILAGAMKDYHRAVIVGDDHTFGKGTVQSVLHLPPGLGAVKVTTGMFFRPGGQSTQHIGVGSDITLPSLYASEEIGEKALDYSIESRKIRSFVSSEANSQNLQKKWKPVSVSSIQALKKKSTNRVRKDKKFQEIKKDLVKAQKKSETIKLAEVRLESEKESKKRKEDEKKSRKQRSEEARAPHVNEAMKILADLVQLQGPHQALTKNE